MLGNFLLKPAYTMVIQGGRKSSSAHLKYTFTWATCPVFDIGLASLVARSVDLCQILGAILDGFGYKSGNILANLFSGLAHQLLGGTI